MSYAKFLKGKRALSKDQLYEVDFPYREYTREIKSGIYTGTLDMKEWGKKACLHCYFTLGDGKKIALTVYHSNQYSPKKSKCDLSDERISVNSIFEVGIGNSITGKNTFESIKYFKKREGNK